MINPPLALIRCHGDAYAVTRLTELGFQTNQSINQDTLQKLDGVLVLGKQDLKVRFRVRDNRNEKAICSFADISSTQKTIIKRFLQDSADEFESPKPIETRNGRSMSQNAATVSTFRTVASTLDQPMVEQGIALHDGPTSEPIAWEPDPIEVELIEIVSEPEPLTGESESLDTRPESFVLESEPEVLARIVQSPPLSVANPPKDEPIVAELVSQDQVQEIDTIENSVAAHIDKEEPRVDSLQFEPESSHIIPITVTPTTPDLEFESPVEFSNPIESLAPCSTPTIIASGKTTSSTPKIKEAQPQTTPGEKSDEKNLANRRQTSRSLFPLWIVLAATGLAALAMSYLNSRTELSLSNATLAGNISTVNTTIEGEINEVLVQRGDVVKKGDVLMRLSNAEIVLAKEQHRTEMEASAARMVALRQRQEVFTMKLSLAAEKLKLDLEAARTELKSAQESEAEARDLVERMTPYLKSGAISRAELEVAIRNLLEFESQTISKSNLATQLEFVKSAIEANILIADDQPDSDLAKVEMEMSIAEADYARSKGLLEITEKQLELLRIVAPRDGIIYAINRHPGEFLKTADEALAIVDSNQRWVYGQSSATAATRIIPGQPATIKFSELDLELSGVVSSVGHRAGEKRTEVSVNGTNAGIPVKIFVKDLPGDISLDQPLSISIKTGFGIKWLDDAYGYEVNSTLVGD